MFGLLSGGQLLAVLIVLVVAIIVFYLWMKDVPIFIGEADLTGKICIVTGANAGIGLSTAREFAKRNARVIMACRSMSRGEVAKEDIIAQTGNKNIVVRELDLSSMKSVRKFADKVNSEEEKVHILVNNAGVLGLPYRQTEDGLEANFATNHFGPFLLTNLLLYKLKQSAPSRIINVSSIIHTWGKLDLDNMRAEKYFKTQEIYFNSKLANVLFTRELARRLQGTGVTAVCLHPGSVQTNLMDNMPVYIRIPMRAFRFVCRTPAEGAQTTLFCALADEVQEFSGKYFAECKLAEHQVNPQANDKDLCCKLWEVSCQFTDFKPTEETAF